MHDAQLPTALHARLARLELLDEEDRSLLDELLQDRRSLSAGATLQEEAAPMERAAFLLGGWAIRARTLAEGDRQILNLLLPGDSVGLQGVLFRESLAGAELLTDGEIAEVPFARIVELFGRSPRLAAALCWMSGQDERLVAQQVVRVGRLPAPERIAHLFLELLHRRRSVGAPEPEARVFPLTQAVLADALGMSHVHANRSCRKLVGSDLIAVQPGRIELLDEASLTTFAGFERDYLDGGGIPVGSRRSIGD